MGDFNIHINNSLNLDATLFEDTLESFSLHNHINFAHIDYKIPYTLIIT